VLWPAALSNTATKYPFLQHCVRSLACLQRDLRDQPITDTPVSSYQHQLLASNLLRTEAPEVNPEDWLAVVAFHVCVLVFQLSTQSTCPETGFDLIGTMRVVRSGHAIQLEVRPYFRKTRFWEFILRRTTGESIETDAALRTNMYALTRVVARCEHYDLHDADDEKRAGISRRACAQLCR
jgi:hypothetical protein